jgi:hypothetical protein
LFYNGFVDSDFFCTAESGGRIAVFCAVFKKKTTGGVVVAATASPAAYRSLKMPGGFEPSDDTRLK